LAGRDRLGELRFRMLVVDALRAVKGEGYSYRTLARMLGVNHTLLARYVAGSLLPSIEQARRLWEGLRGLVNLGGRIRRQLMGGGVLDLSDILSSPLHLRIASLEFLDRFRGVEVSKILVPETSGISLATALALAFDVPLVIARRRKNVPGREYLEASVSLAPNIVRIFYIPRGSLAGGDSVLVVDDLIQSGLTLEAMRRLVESSGARLAGVAAVVVYGSSWRARARLPPEARVEALAVVEGVEG
jgi:adenine phosphoribosyltransferase